MTTQRIILTPAPGAIFLRVNTPAIEMTPGEALRLREQLDRVIGIALGVQDGRNLLRQIPDRLSPDYRQAGPDLSN